MIIKHNASSLLEELKPTPSCRDPVEVSIATQRQEITASVTTGVTGRVKWFQ
jgi:hypothetical protein